MIQLALLLNSKEKVNRMNCFLYHTYNRKMAIFLPSFGKSFKVDFVTSKENFCELFFILHMTQNSWNVMCQYFAKYFFSFQIIRMLGLLKSTLKSF